MLKRIKYIILSTFLIILVGCLNNQEETVLNTTVKVIETLPIETTTIEETSPIETTIGILPSTTEKPVNTITVPMETTIITEPTTTEPSSEETLQHRDESDNKTTYSYPYLQIGGVKNIYEEEKEKLNPLLDTLNNNVSNDMSLQDITGKEFFKDLTTINNEMLNKRFNGFSFISYLYKIFYGNCEIVDNIDEFKKYFHFDSDYTASQGTIMILSNGDVAYLGYDNQVYQVSKGKIKIKDLYCGDYDGSKIREYWVFNKNNNGELNTKADGARRDTTPFIQSGTNLIWEDELIEMRKVINRTHFLKDGQDVSTFMDFYTSDSAFEKPRYDIKEELIEELLSYGEINTYLFISFIYRAAGYKDLEGNIIPLTDNAEDFFNYFTFDPKYKSSYGTILVLQDGSVAFYGYKNRVMSIKDNKVVIEDWYKTKRFWGDAIVEYRICKPIK